MPERSDVAPREDRRRRAAWYSMAPLLTTVQGAAREPLAFSILDVANRLTAGGATVPCRVAGRGRGVFVAARPIA